MDEELNEDQAPASLRDALNASMDAADAAGQGSAADTGNDTGADDAQRARDDKGRFAARQAAEQAAAPVVDQQAAPAPADNTPKLTTWRKEYLPIQQKLEQGVPLLPEEAKKLADYNLQREREYATGISSHRAEAQHAKQITDAMGDFMPILQQQNINPADWIRNLGTAHRTLAMGSPQEKLAMFQRLAHDYNIPLGAVQQMQDGGQVDPTTMQLMQQMAETRNSVQQMAQWREQQEMQSINNELAKFTDASKYPHFEQVRGEMAQLLESGFAQDLDTAYTKAVRMNDDAWNAETQRQAAASATSQAANKAAAVAKARQASGSVRSGSSAATTSVAPSNNLRENIVSAFDQHDAGGRV